MNSRKKESPPRKYLAAGCKPWNRRAFEEVIRRLPGEWEFVGSPEELTRAVRA